ncbi:FecR domain-containing protein [Asticcacaulis sp. BYS171W]|uniref:FecR domain-containing protein n=1 Tax=Asticcacaulis aquaticus TaxID=2984212 RepID=A0ABT5HX04_9CAUL|nr:FecR domain-containing protein [Asticcacaulis aquaticus]MDC7684614.1 FecR domain-containing protein [Asticcacaulis aquaticus]
MSFDDIDIEGEAADWVIRSQSGAISESEIVALTDWMDRSPRHAEAYRRVSLLWSGLNSSPDGVTEPAAEPVPMPRPEYGFQHPLLKPAYMAAFGGGVATLMAAVLAFNAGVFAPVTVYETPKGEREEVVLADGTHLTLNTDTRISVKLTDRQRHVTLEKGEIAVNVVHDEAHPFVIRTGKVTLTDIGTEFNVSRLDGEVRVAVREGEVELASSATPAKRLLPGDYGVHTEATGRNVFTRTDPQEAFAWTTAHAIYRDQPLSVVVKDLNRYFHKPIIVDDAAGQLRLSTIMTLDSQDAVAGRLTEFLPVKVRTTHEALYISRRSSAGPASGGNGV